MKPEQQKIVDAASQWIGTPYRHQASRLGVGCDCLGLVRGVWRTLYGQEPDKIPAYSQFGKEPSGAKQLLTAANTYLVPHHKQIQAGLVVLFQMHKTIDPRHCGVLLEGKMFVHAQERLGVIVSNLDTRWTRRIHSTYSFPTKA